MVSGMGKEKVKNSRLDHASLKLQWLNYSHHQISDNKCRQAHCCLTLKNKPWNFCLVTQFSETENPFTERCAGMLMSLQTFTLRALLNSLIRPNGERKSVPQVKLLSFGQVRYKSFSLDISLENYGNVQQQRPFGPPRPCKPKDLF